MQLWRFGLFGGGSKSRADGYLCETDKKKTKRNGKSPDDYFIFNLPDFACTTITSFISSFIYFVFLSACLSLLLTHAH